ncbi:hypothetical protein [Companilactobacillus ginsenosidimutans]|uniref:Uncharacterized protein n=1 Tax=Companilactobacillus ginsenosidimutans TaxID=1007676 RepID=A0A0H4QHW0_9LACO|nr:hypothetical protein [Companilactobacillus ginsenosidimutans]AKP66243.1 hypothetical protein ABM34_00875 [Companilactobacillus ginsenosidimutans]
MQETTYYSVMKKDELALPWTNDAQQVLELLKNDKDAMLMSMTGKEDENTREWIEHGMIETFEQETLDQLVGSQKEKNMYLDNAFTIMDDLDKKGSDAHSPYVSALYLVAALSRKLMMPEKMTWILGMAVAYGVGFNGKINQADYGVASWNKDDAKFIEKLNELPTEPPIWSKNKVTIRFEPVGNMYYYQVAIAFQDIMELMKLNSGDFSFANLQNEHSFELIHMAYELAKFYPKNS